MTDAIESPLNHEQVTRVAALQLARPLVITTGFVSATAPKVRDLIIVADYILGNINPKQTMFDDFIRDLLLHPMAVYVRTDDDENKTPDEPLTPETDVEDALPEAEHRYANDAPATPLV